MNTSFLKTLKLLYVEDDKNVQISAEAYFNRIFKQTYVASNAKEGMALFQEEKPHIVITDIELGGMNGIELIKKIREKNQECQIIVLSAFTTTEYLLDAIELNLIKYLTKPICFQTMQSTLEQCAKNLLGISSDISYFNENSYYDSKKNLLIQDNKSVKFSNNEKNLIDLLCKRKNTIVSYEEIEHYIWFDTYMSENALRTLVKKLRTKLPKNTLENISKIGYKIQCIAS